MVNYKELIIPVIGSLVMALAIGLLTKDTYALIIAAVASLTTLLLNISMHLCKLEQKINKLLEENDVN